MLKAKQDSPLHAPKCVCASPSICDKAHIKPMGKVIKVHGRVRSGTVVKQWQDKDTRSYLVQNTDTDGKN